MALNKIIGIDIDNTLFYCNSRLYNFLSGLKFSSQKNILKYSEISYNAKPKVNALFKRLFKFFNAENYKEFPDAINTINRFSEEGKEVYIITARPNIKPFVESLQEWLNSKNLKYSKLIVGCNNKAEFVKQNNIEIYIDDLPRNCLEIEDAGAKTILFEGITKCEKVYKKLVKPEIIARNWTQIHCQVNRIFTIKESANQAQNQERI